MLPLHPRRGTSMKRLGIAVVAGLCLFVVTTTRAQTPFGGDDTGCVPDTRDHRRCSQSIVEAFGKLIKGVTFCHVKQATAAFHGSSTDEESCETGKPKGRFDAAVTMVAPICSSAVLAGAGAEEAVLLAPATATPMSLDAQNGNVYCDGTVAIDGTGEDAGKIPLSADGLKCAEKVAKNLSKLAGAVLKCHYKAANAAFRKKHFDEEACEMAALGKYDAT